MADIANTGKDREIKERLKANEAERRIATRRRTMDGSARAASGSDKNHEGRGRTPAMGVGRKRLA